VGECNNTTTALTLTLLPTETTVAIDLWIIVELFLPVRHGNDGNRNDLFECLPTMPARDMDVLLAADFVKLLPNQHGDVLELQGRSLFSSI
jgi:hypothetical protein